MNHESRRTANYARDREYWNNYYSGVNDALSKPSSFAESILGELDRGGHILDIGCGNGRDSLYFLANGLKVTGIDASDVAIEKLRGITSGNESAEFLCGDFVNDTRIYAQRYDYAYSRFTLHAITFTQQNELLTNIKNVLEPGGRLGSILRQGLSAMTFTEKARLPGIMRLFTAGIIGDSLSRKI